MTLYVCPDCRFTWDSSTKMANRSPPYPWCPDCSNPMLRRLNESEAELWDAGMTPARL